MSRPSAAFTFDAPGPHWRNCSGVSLRSNIGSASRKPPSCNGHIKKRGSNLPSIGLTGQQYPALLLLRATPAASEPAVNELARPLLIAPRSAVGLVDRRVDQGYLMPKASHEDARQVTRRLIAHGTRVLGPLADIHRHELAHAGPQRPTLLAQAARAL